MDRTLFANENNGNTYKLGYPNAPFFGLLDLNSFFQSKAKIEITPRTKVDLLIKLGEKCENLDIVVGEGADLNLQLLSLYKDKNLKFIGHLSSQASMIISFADFTAGSGLIEATISLLGDKSNVEWHLSSLASEEDHKKYIINIDNLHPNTYSSMTNLGVTEQKSNLTFFGQGHIIKGAKNSKSNQVAKILVFDPESVAKVNPILIIDENEVIASHAASVGKVNEEHLFYLQSRGLNESQAKRLLMMSYLEPVIGYFSDENDKKTLLEIIESRI